MGNCSCWATSVAGRGWWGHHMGDQPGRCPAAIVPCRSRAAPALSPRHQPARLQELLFTESQNALVWKKPMRIIQSNSWLCTDSPTPHPVPESVVQMLLNSGENDWLTPFSKPVLKAEPKPARSWCFPSKMRWEGHLGKGYPQEQFNSSYPLFYHDPNWTLGDPRISSQPGTDAATMRRFYNQPT